MFICAQCRKEMPESERCSIRWLTNIGFHFMAGMPWWPSDVCKCCSKQVLLLSMIGVIIAAVVVTILVVGNWLSWAVQL